MFHLYLLGQFLKKEDVNRLVDPLVRLICRSNTSQSLARRAKERLESAWFEMPKEIDAKVIKRVEAWIKTYREKGDESSAKTLESLSFLSEIPF